MISMSAARRHVGDRVVLRPFDTKLQRPVPGIEPEVGVIRGTTTGYPRLVYVQFANRMDTADPLDLEWLEAHP